MPRRKINFCSSLNTISEMGWLPKVDCRTNLFMGTIHNDLTSTLAKLASHGKVCCIVRKLLLYVNDLTSTLAKLTAEVSKDLFSRC